MRIALMLLLALTLYGCGAGNWGQKIDTIEAIKAAQLFGQKMKYQKRLFFIDSVVHYDENIRRFRLDFSTQAILSLCEARALLVDVVDDFLAYLNANGSLICSHGMQPFTECDLEVYITGTTFYGYYNDVNRVGLITMRSGISHFFTFSTLDPDRDHWKKREEYFWQSRLFVEYWREGRDLYDPYLDTYDKPPIEERYVPSEGGRPSSAGSLKTFDVDANAF